MSRGAGIVFDTDRPWLPERRSPSELLLEAEVPADMFVSFCAACPGPKQAACCRYVAPAQQTRRAALKSALAPRKART